MRSCDDRTCSSMETDKGRERDKLALYCKDNINDMALFEPNSISDCEGFSPFMQKVNGLPLIRGSISNSALPDQATTPIVQFFFFNSFALSFCSSSFHPSIIPLSAIHTCVFLQCGSWQILSIAHQNMSALSTICLASTRPKGMYALEWKEQRWSSGTERIPLFLASLWYLIEQPCKSSRYLERSGWIYSSSSTLWWTLVGSTR